MTTGERAAPTDKRRIPLRLTPPKVDPRVFSGGDRVRVRVARRHVCKRGDFRKLAHDPLVLALAEVFDVPLETIRRMPGGWYMVGDVVFAVHPATREFLQVWNSLDDTILDTWIEADGHGGWMLLESYLHQIRWLGKGRWYVFRVV